MRSPTKRCRLSKSSLWSHTYLGNIVGSMVAPHTHNLLWFFFFFTLAHVQTQFTEEFSFSFSVSLLTHKWLYADTLWLSLSLPLSHTFTQPHSQSCTTEAFPAVYQTNVWVVFSSSGLNILFHFPLSHCLTHKHTNMCPGLAHTMPTQCSLHALAKRDSDPCSTSKRLMFFLGRNKILCHYKVLHYRTPE